LEGNYTLWVSDNSPIDCDIKFPKTWDGWKKTYNSKDQEQKNNPAKWDCKGPFLYASGHAAYWGDWFTNWSGWSDQGAVADCPATVGSDNNNPSGDQWTKWTLDGTNCYKWSEYSYPADGTSNKPHTWSYHKVNAGYGRKVPKHRTTTLQRMDLENSTVFRTRLMITPSLSTS